jgi:hypothetical protein
VSQSIKATSRYASGYPTAAKNIKLLPKSGPSKKCTVGATVARQTFAKSGASPLFALVGDGDGLIIVAYSFLSPRGVVRFRLRHA